MILLSVGSEANCPSVGVMAELEKLGPKYRIALRIARDERWERLKCDHKGVYADDCLVDRVMKHKVYIVATNDRDLKRRIRKIPGVPIMSVARGSTLSSGCRMRRRGERVGSEGDVRRCYVLSEYG